MSPFPEIAPFRSATPFVVAGFALLWYQRGGLMLSRMDQFRSVADQLSATERTLAGVSRQLCLAIIVAIAVPYLASAYWLKTFTGSSLLRSAA